MVEMDVERVEVKVNGKPKDLTPKEFALLRLLAEADGKVVGRERLIDEVWGEAYAPGDTRTVDQHIAHLCYKLRPEQDCVVTVTSQGYKAVNVRLSQPVAIPVGKVQAITRGFGKKPYAIVTARFEDSLPKLSKGGKVLVHG